MAYEDYPQGLGALEQGGNRFIAKDGFNFYLSDTDLDADRIKLSLLSLINVVHRGMSAIHVISGTSDPEVLSPGYGYHFFSASTGNSLASAHFPPASKGAILVIDCSYIAGDAEILIGADSYTGGPASVSLYNQASVRCSSLNMSTGGVCKLVCHTDYIWSIVWTNANAVGRAAA